MNDQESKLNLRKEVLSGTVWSAVGLVATTALRFIIMLVLARLLSPEYFGLFGMATIVMLILRDVSDMGFGSALVQRKHIDKVDLSTIFWFNLAISFLLAGGLFLGANFLSQVMGEQDLEPILRMLAILLPINALTVVPQVMLRRNLKFSQLAWRDFIGMIGFGLVGISFSLAGMGAWSLIGALAAQWIFRAASIWLASPFSPSFQFDLTRLRSLSGFSSWMFISMLAARLMVNIDYFIIGRFLGATALGYYTLAFQLVVIPIQRITGVLNGVMFPTFSKIQNQIARLRSSFLYSLRMLTLIITPISAFFFVSADVLVPFLYSDKWLPAIPIVKLLALASFFYSLDVMNSMLDGIGKPNWRFAVLSLRAIIFVSLAWIWGLAYGTEGIALCILVATALSNLLQIGILMHELHLTVVNIGRAIYIPLLGIILPTFFAWWIKNSLAKQSDFIQLFMMTTVFGLTYILMILPGYRDELQQIISSLTASFDLKKHHAGKHL